MKSYLADERNPLCLPTSKPLPGREKPIPYVLSGDDAFPLTKDLMKPYPLSQLTSEQ